MHPNAILIITLWLLVLGAYTLPRLYANVAAVLRGGSRSSHVTLFCLMALAAAFYAFPSSADKGTPPDTNPPPATVRGVIRLYHQDAAGRLVPLGAEIKEARP